eukprot:4063230-Pleurochrysis_carterae.AAC.1
MIHAQPLRLVLGQTALDDDSIRVGECASGHPFPIWSGVGPAGPTLPELRPQMLPLPPVTQTRLSSRLNAPGPL